MNFLLCCSLLTLLVFFYYIEGKDYLAPSILLCFFFFVSSLDLLLNTNDWGNISLKTYVIIIISMIVFYVCSLLFSSRKYIRFFNKKKIKFKLIPIPTFIIIATIIAQVFLLLLVIKGVEEVTGQRNLFAAISSYADTKIIGSVQQLSRISSNSYYINNYIGYGMGFIGINNFIVRKKIDIFILISFLISVISGMMQGSRGLSLYLLVSMVIIFLIQNRFASGKRSLNPKYLISALAIGVIGAIIFGAIGRGLGRSSATTMNTFEYLSHYLGAPLINLNSFVNHQLIVQSTSWGLYTFVAQINWVSSQSIIPYLPFNVVNGQVTGNVYTMIFPYLIDFGIIGVIICTAIMSLIVNFTYKLIYIKTYELYNNNSNERIPFFWRAAGYSFFSYSIIFGFFSNKFYESITTNIIKYIIIIFIFYLISKHFMDRNKSSITF